MAFSGIKAFLASKPLQPFSFKIILNISLLFTKAFDRLFALIFNYLGIKSLGLSWSELVWFLSFVIIHESRISGMYFETQMAGELSKSQILLKLGVKWPLVKAFQLG